MHLCFSFFSLAPAPSNSTRVRRNRSLIALLPARLINIIKKKPQKIYSWLLISCLNCRLFKPILVCRKQNKTDIAGIYLFNPNRMTLMRKTGLSLVCSLIAFVTFSQQQYPKTLLWRISGNGLQTPSYLFGTMHLTDKRLFNFDDSVYRAIEQSKGLAIEVNPDEMAAYYVNEMFDEIQDSKSVNEILSDKDFKKYSKSLSKKFGKPAEEITAKDIVEEKNKWVNEYLKKGEMPTFVDAYLYNIARRQGKWVGGIEDIADQADLLEEMIDKTDIEVLLAGENEAESKSYLEAMINVYTAQDIYKLDSMMNDSYNASKKDRLLIKRNIKMAMRMDSLAAERSMFFAVGAAHLPGQDGVIDLLRKRGFTVEPVLCNSKMDAKNYHFTETEIPWVVNNDVQGLYNVMMPGNAADVKLLGLMDMKFLFDIFNMSGFCTMAVVSPKDFSNQDKLYDDLVYNMFKTRKKIPFKKIRHEREEGREYTYSKDDATIRMQVFLKDKVLYMALMYATKKESIVSSDADKFFASFKINDKVDKNTTTNYNFSDPVMGVSFSSPAALTFNKKLSTTTDNNWNVKAYTGTDIQNGTYIMFFSKSVKPGSYIIHDSTLNGEMADIMMAKLKDATKKDIRMQGYNGFAMEGTSTDDKSIKMKMLSYVRGNRNVMLMVVADQKQINEPAIQNILNSFKFLPYQKITWQQYKSTDGDFSAWAPSPFEVLKNDKEEETNQIVSFDSTSATSFTVITDTFSKYSWYENDSSFWDAQLKSYNSYSDTLLNVSTITNGNVKGKELLIQKRGGEIYKRIRLLVNGNLFHTLYASGEKKILFSSDADKFFSGLLFENTPQVFDIYAPKTAMILQDLSSPDTTIRRDAYSELYNAPLSKDDAPLLNEALFKTYEKLYAKGDAVTINDRIGNRLVSLEDEGTAQYIKEHTALLEQRPEIRNVAADVLSGIKTKESYETLIQLLEKYPLTENPGYYFGNHLEDSSALTLTIYPRLLNKAKDSMLCLSIADLSLTLLDSGYIKLADIMNAEKDFIANAAALLPVLKDSANYYRYGLYSLARLLARYNTPAANKMLHEYLSVADVYLRKEVAMALLKNEQQVNPDVWKQLASDAGVRKDLYDEMKDLNKASLFPAQYLTQQYFAESDVYYAASDDDEPSSIKFVSDKTISFRGKKYRFYLYKVTFGADDDAESYLGISGGYSISGKSLEASEDVSGLYWEEGYDATAVEEQLKAYLDGFEKTED